MHATLTDDVTAAPFAALRDVNTRIAGVYPGDPAERQPVHTVYGGAHLFRPDTAARLGRLALRALEAYAPDAAAMARVLDLPPAAAATVYDRVVEKLEREPVEDFRIDFEDGYGARPDDEEDACAVAAGEAVARGLADGTLPPFIGIRIKPLTAELHGRGVRTLDLFVTALLGATGGRLPEHFVITVPKVMDPGQVSAFVDVLDFLEAGAGLDAGSLRIELMIETTASIIGADGAMTLPRLAAAARGRCRAAHFGVYDYTAGCNITAHHQSMAHPACDFARHAMQVAFSGTGVTISDGATNIMPVGPHRAPADGPPLTAAQRSENEQAVHRAWRLHYDDVRRSLRHAFYQGWDLNPAQLPTRYAAVYAFFLESLASASERLRNFVDQAAQATLSGDVFDDAATGQGLLNFFLRGLNCGAITAEEARATGLTLDELRSRSFTAILAGRRAG